MNPDFQSIAAQHGLSTGAVLAAWNALHTGGSMAQFNHPELGGHGQWMPGMLMIGDMFNHDLKARVDRLFHALAKLTPDSPAPAPTASRERSSPQDDRVSLSYNSGSTSAENWYPSNLGTPSTIGSQNAVRYAYFPGPRRLAIELAGKLTIYDAGPHLISGVSQGQTDDAGSIRFTSRFGVMAVATLNELGPNPSSVSADESLLQREELVP